MRPFRIEEIEAQLLALGVQRGGVLLVHTSYRRVRPVEDGPLGLIRALQRVLGPEGTLVMPTMTDGESVFDPRATPSSDMGVTAELFWRQSGVLRSGHPGASFAASGALAERICAPQPLAPPHGRDSPPGRVHELGGQVLLLGVEPSESTLLHVAESLAYVPYFVEHACVVEVDGMARRVMIRETDHCCRGFSQMDEWLDARGLQRRGRLGNANAKLAHARDIVAVALERLARNHFVFLCRVGECAECDRAWASVGKTP